MASSPSLSRFLRFLVEETVAGRSEEINEYNLGVRVFLRGADFNPRTDPIVRVQTHHLRSRLARYYAKSGAGDPLVIELPSRTYVPLFREVEQPAATSEVAAATASAISPARQEPASSHGAGRPIAVSAAVPRRAKPWEKPKRFRCSSH
jgi:hypothetical protein